MATFAVMITFGDAALRDKVRPAHREFLRAQLDAGHLVQSGPFVDDTGALLIYEAESEEALRGIVAEDPYSQNEGIVANLVIKEWNTVISRA